MKERRDILDNPRSGRVKKIQALSRRSLREKTGLIAVQGPQAVRELLLFAPTCVVDVYCEQELFETAQHRPQVLELLTLIERSTPYLHIVTPSVMHAMGDGTQGILAVARAQALPKTVDLQGNNPATLLLLPCTQDPGNVGAMVRLADASGCRAVLLGQGSANVDSPKVIRFSAGSVFHIPALGYESLPEFSKEQDSSVIGDQREFGMLVAYLRNLGWQIWGTDGSASIELGGPGAQEEDFAKGKIVWVMGNEAAGLSPEQKNLCDRIVRIRMFGQAESLNVTHAATLCLFASANAQNERRN